MPDVPGRDPRESRRLVVRLVIVFDVLIVLFPPLHWAVGSPGSYAALGYFVLTSALLLVSLFVIYGLARVDEES